MLEEGNGKARDGVRKARAPDRPLTGRVGSAPDMCYVSRLNKQGFPSRARDEIETIKEAFWVETIVMQIVRR